MTEELMFEPEDFKACTCQIELHTERNYSEVCFEEMAANIANRVLAEKLAKLPKAYGNKHQNLDVMFWQSGSDISGKENQSHVAILVDLRQRKKGFRTWKD